VNRELHIKPHRPRRRSAARFLFDGSTGGALQLTDAGYGAPSLALAEPEDDRARWISGSLVALLHLIGLGLILLAAALAPPELIERVIPVEILREAEPVALPGSNAELAPSGPAGPKTVGAARPSAAAMSAAQVMSPAQLEALRQAALAAARAELERMQAQALREVALPTQIERREVQSQSVAARAASAATPDVVTEHRDVETTTIDPADLAALDLDPRLQGPRTIDPSSLTDLSAAEAFAVLAEIGTGDYSGAVEATPSTRIGGIGAGEAGDSGGGIDTGLAGAYGGGGSGGPGTGTGPGGTGTARNVVDCLDSLYVQRYLEMVRERTNRRWTIPYGVAPDTQVVMRFDLDASGMATNVQADNGTDNSLGQSTRLALLGAAPFPPMNDDNRCLSEKRIKPTFTVPSD